MAQASDIQAKLLSSCLATLKTIKRDVHSLLALLLVSLLLLTPHSQPLISLCLLSSPSHSFVLLPLTSLTPLSSFLSLCPLLSSPPLSLLLSFYLAFPLLAF